MNDLGVDPRHPATRSAEARVKRARTRLMVEHGWRVNDSTRLYAALSPDLYRQAAIIDNQQFLGGLRVQCDAGLTDDTVLLRLDYEAPA